MRAQRDSREPQTEDSIMEQHNWYCPITLLGMGVYDSAEFQPMNSEEMILTLTDEDLEDWGLAIDARRASNPIRLEEISECF
jgi:hypothetical protein